MRLNRRYGVSKRKLPKRCNVGCCPERYRCLDIDTPSRCASWRVWNSGRQILRGK